MSDFGVYIHFPWCRRRCSYCDFAIAVAPLDRIPHEQYRDAVIAELDYRVPMFSDRHLRSIYFGGGTPSLWRPDCIDRVVDAVRARFAGAAGALEVTVEANPIDCTAGALDDWRAAGINRLSIGVQSTSDAELAVLGRDHAMGDGVRAVEGALSRDEFRVSADVIFGVPGRESSLASVDRLVELGVPHLSIYELTLADRAPLSRRVARGQLPAPGEDEVAASYQRLHHRLVGLGYQHYEVSSFARPGHRAVHNSLYWRGGEWLGLGCSAASCLRDGDGARQWVNHRSVGRYLARGVDDLSDEVHRLDRDDAESEAAWLGLRTSDGVSRLAFEGRERLLSGLVDDRLVEEDGSVIRPTLRGFLFCDRLAGRIIDGWRYNQTEP